MHYVADREDKIMKSQTRLLVIRVTVITLLTIFTGCAPTLSLRNDLFRGQPLWESEMFGAEEAAAKAGRTQLRPDDAPGLYFLVEQVLPGHKALAVTEERLEKFTPFGVEGFFTVEDRQPLPAEIAELKLTKVYVSTLLASYTGEPLADVKLTLTDFRRFGEALLTSNAALYQSNPHPRAPRLRRIAAFANEKKVTWDGIAYTYFAAYYQGKFVDRTGGALSRPKLGFKITNETITAAITVGLESLYDYAVFGSNKIKNPVVWIEKDGKEIFQTAENRKPTLVTVTQHLLGRTPDDPTLTIPYVVEPLQTDQQKPGITKRKLEIIRLLSGYASDAAAALSDLIIRTFGGIDIGFVLLGKFSIGDNDTLAKIVQTIVDSKVERATEMSVATYLYDRVKRKAPPGMPRTVAEIFGYE